jgi:hypothetical protein
MERVITKKIRVISGCTIWLTNVHEGNLINGIYEYVFYFAWYYFISNRSRSLLLIRGYLINDLKILCSTQAHSRLISLGIV